LYHSVVPGSDFRIYNLASLFTPREAISSLLLDQWSYLSHTQAIYSSDVTNRQIIFSDGELAVKPFQMVRIDNIFGIYLSQTQAIVTILRIDIIIFSNGELPVHPLQMVRIDNIFEAYTVYLSHTQTIVAMLRIDI
jgi:Holliday junction resolvase-like predicted endonuclease